MPFQSHFGPHVTGLPPCMQNEGADSGIPDARRAVVICPSTPSSLDNEPETQKFPAAIRPAGTIPFIEAPCSPRTRPTPADVPPPADSAPVRSFKRRRSCAHGHLARVARAMCNRELHRRRLMR